MKNQLASVELKVLVGEFQQLKGARLEKVYDLNATAGGKAGKSVVLQLNKSEGRKLFMVLLAPSAVFFSASKPELSEDQSRLCSILRHHLDNARLVSINQLASERILEFVFSSAKGELKLIVELFSKGNIVLLNDQGVIVDAAELQHWKDRTIRPGFLYSPPPASADFASISKDQFSSLILSSGKSSVVKVMAVDVGLSGTYAEEVCSIARLEKDRQPKELSASEIGLLYSSLQQLLSRKSEPIAALDDKNAIREVFPFPLKSFSAASIKSFDSFNDAVSSSVLLLLESSAVSERQASFNRRIRELEIAIEQQKATIIAMERVVQESTAVAEAIYLNYAEVKQILDDYNLLRKTFTPVQLREYFKSDKKVVSIDEKTGTITLELA